MTTSNSRCFPRLLGIISGVALLSACGTGGGLPADAPAAAVRAEPAPVVPARQAALAAGLRGANRVELARLTLDGREQAEFTRRGAELGERFLEFVQVDETAGEFRSSCETSHVLRFFRDETLLATLELHQSFALRWRDGPWTTDAALVSPKGNGFFEWLNQTGGQGQFITPVEGVAQAMQARSDGDQQFLAQFPQALHPYLPVGDGAMTTSFQPVRRQSPLAVLQPDATQFAISTFRALGGHYLPWLDDDLKTARTQTIVAAMGEEQWGAALAPMAGEDQALRGAARIYFRFALHRRFGTGFNALWLPRLADAMLRTGGKRDTPLLLIHVAEAEVPAAREVLHAIATGGVTYPWDRSCGFRGDVTAEPSLPMAAALLLAVRGDAAAADLVAHAPRTTFGLDAAAAAVAQSLFAPARPVAVAALRYRSHLLGYAAARALQRQPVDAITLGALRAGLDHSQWWIGGLARQVADTHRFRRISEIFPYEIHEAPVSDFLNDDPVEILRQCSEHLATATGRQRGPLLIMRGVFRERTGDVAGAIEDLTAALAVPGYPAHVLHARLAWLEWARGRLIETSRHVEESLAEKADADLFFLRGLGRYAVGDFGPATDLAFSTSLGLKPNHGYAEVFQHLVAHLSGKPPASRLSGQPEYLAPTKTSLNLHTSGGLSVVQSNAPIPPWPAALIAYFKGELTEAQLLERAPPGNDVLNCEAHFYLSQRARIDGRTADEKAHLELATRKEILAVAEYRAAVIRLGQLR